MPKEGGKPWPNGWYSRKHKTRQAHDAWRQRRDEREAQYWADIARRKKERAGRSAAEQLAQLDKGGFRALKERKRLAAQIEAQGDKSGQ